MSLGPGQMRDGVGGGQLKLGNTPGPQPDRTQDRARPSRPLPVNFQNRRSQLGKNHTSWASYLPPT